MWGRDALVSILLLAMIVTAALGVILPAVWIVSALVVVAATSYLWTALRHARAERLEGGRPPAPRP